MNRLFWDATVPERFRASQKGNSIINPMRKDICERWIARIFLGRDFSVSWPIQSLVAPEEFDPAQQMNAIKTFGPRGLKVSMPQVREIWGLINPRLPANVQTLLRRDLLDLIENGSMTPDEASVHLGHVLGLVFERLGLISYSHAMSDRQARRLGRHPEFADEFLANLARRLREE